MLAALARRSVLVAMDDFGTGHASLRDLKRFDINTLKIDRSVVSELPRDPQDTAISRAITAMSHSLPMKVVAECVETIEQADCLRELGCDEMQGCLLSRPLPPDALVTWLLHRMADKLEHDTAPRWAGSGPLTLITMDMLCDPACGTRPGLPAGRLLESPHD